MQILCDPINENNLNFNTSEPNCNQTYSENNIMLDNLHEQPDYISNTPNDFRGI